METPLESPVLLCVVVALPLVAGMLLAWRAARPMVLAFAPWSSLPAVVLSLTVRPGAFVHPPWLLFGTRVGLDETGCVFLLFTAVLWTVAGLYARTYLADDARRTRFFAFFLATMAGNLGLVVAGDMGTFYLFFALMSFASYGLIIHNADAEAQWAGKVYIILVVVGEILLFVGMLMAYRITGSLDLNEVPTALGGSPQRDVVVGCLITGFGIKVGAIPLHVWLPLAHPVAPTPASAVLSGVLIKAGLLGWLRFLPLGEATLPEWGGLCVVAGLAAAFFGVIAGAVQDNAKVVLAYSSISQMGLMTIGLGAALAAPQSWPQVLPALWIYALHHALAKGALFLGVGVSAATGCQAWQRPLIAAGLLLPSLALAGAPLTSGAAAKIALKSSLTMLPPAWAAALDWLLPLTAAGTTIVMARFLFLALGQRKQPGSHPPAGLWLPWVVLLAGVAIAVWIVPWDDFRDSARKSVLAVHFVGNAWPVLAGAGLAWMAWNRTRRSAIPMRCRIPSGDILIPITWLIDRLYRSWRARVRFHPAVHLLCHRYGGTSLWHRLRLPHVLARIERGLTRWPVVGTLLLVVAGTILALLILR
jgi:formate hydrogenlyase subunit 3/multisubunit Na+/H+ antiporter MnhD subunit